MDLFTSVNGSDYNLLPYEGEVYYYGKILTASQANDYFEKLMHCIQWKNDEAFIFGKRILTKRKVAWYADTAFEYTYSNITKKALQWTKELLDLKTLVENFSGETYNSCLLNLYHNGDEGMAWHSDGEKDLKKDGAIASVSFGAERKFAFKHKKDQSIVSKVLENGSLLVMKGSTQTYWLHRLPPTKTIHKARINLTFRTIINNDLSVI